MAPLWIPIWASHNAVYLTLGTSDGLHVRSVLPSTVYNQICSVSNTLCQVAGMDVTGKTVDHMDMESLFRYHVLYSSSCLCSNTVHCSIPLLNCVISSKFRQSHLPSTPIKAPGSCRVPLLPRSYWCHLIGLRPLHCLNSATFILQISTDSLMSLTGNYGERAVPWSGHGQQ